MEMFQNGAFFRPAGQSGRPQHVRLLMDRDLKKQAWFACHPCINTSSLKFKTADLFEKVIPAMGHEPTFLDL